MAGALGDLVIALHADTAAFASDMGRAARISEREWKKVGDHATAAGKAIAGAALIAGAAALKMGSDFINAAADLDDLAEKTGASVEELSKLSQQAYISGASMETIEMGLIRLTKALHGTDEESKGAGKALAALGLKADELRNKDTAESLRIVAGELNKYQDGAGKTALALDLFGKSGAQLLPILKDMATEGALNAKVTAQQAAEAEELGKSWRRLVNDAKAVGQSLALDMVPKIAQLIEQFREGIRIAGGFGAALRLFGLSNITQGNAGEKIREVTAEMAKLTAQREKFIAQGRTGWVKTIDAQLADLEKQKQFASLMLQQKLGDKDNFDPAFGGVKPRIDYKQNADAAKKAAKEGMTFEELMLKAHMKRLQMQEQAEAEATRIGEAEEAERLKGREAGMQAYFKYIDDKIEAEENAMRLAAGFDENGRALKEAVDASKDASEQVSAFWDEAFRNMQRSASDFLYGVMQGDFDNFGTRFKQTMDRMVADWIAAQAMMEATNYLKRNFQGGQGSFGFLEKIIGTVGNWIGGEQAPAPVETRASGGPVTRGMSYLVGERGPEMFVPKESGTIVPNGQRAGSIIFNVYANDPNAFRLAKRQIMGELAAL